jgi:hypothetical protein
MTTRHGGSSGSDGKERVLTSEWQKVVTCGCGKRAEA